MHRHLKPKAVTFSGNVLLCFRTQSIHPDLHRRPRSRVPLPLLGLQLMGQSHRRKLAACRISSEYAFSPLRRSARGSVSARFSVRILGYQRRAKTSSSRSVSENLHTPRIHRFQRVISARPRKAKPAVLIPPRSALTSHSQNQMPPAHFFLPALPAEASSAAAPAIKVDNASQM